MLHLHQIGANNKNIKVLAQCTNWDVFVKKKKKTVFHVNKQLQLFDYLLTDQACLKAMQIYYN